jgi:hypothetical protein
MNWMSIDYPFADKPTQIASRIALPQIKADNLKINVQKIFLT